MESTVYILIGYPGVGKYTIANAMRQQLLAAGTAGRVVDNHSINNQIFGLIDLPSEGSLPRAVWDRVDEVRGAVLRTVEEQSPRNWWFIFTNYLIKGADEPYLRRLDRLTERRGAVLVPVVLRCAADEVLRRVVQPDRRDRLKDTNVTRASQALATHELVDPDLPQSLHMDVTSLPPDCAAARILEHAEAAIPMVRQSAIVERFFGDLSAADLQRPCTQNQLPGHRPWDARDHLAHLAFRERGFHELLDRIQQGDSEPLRARGATREERDAFVNEENERDVETHRGESRERLVDAWLDARAETLRRVAALSDEVRNLPLSLPDASAQVTVRALLLSPVRHADAHLDQIRRGLGLVGDRTR